MNGLALFLAGCGFISEAELTYRQGSSCNQELYPDLDDDGFGDALASPVISCGVKQGFQLNNFDCDDGNASINPDAAEDCATRADDNCSGSANEEDAEDCQEWFVDVDGDGFGAGESLCLCAALSPFTAEESGDCDDTAVSVNPAEIEVCNDGVDNNCDESAEPCGLSSELADSEVLYLGANPRDFAGSSLAFGERLIASQPSIAIGAPGADVGSNLDVGAVYVHPLSQGDWVLGAQNSSVTLNGAGGLFGDSLETADVNLDGVTDLMVAAPTNSEFAAASGAVYLYYGPLEQLQSPDFALYGSASGDRFGESISVINSTGAIVVGAPNDDSFKNNGGVAYIYSASFTEAGSVRIWGESSGDRFATSVDCTDSQPWISDTDLNGDGIADLLVGAPNAAGGQGEAKLFMGPFEEDAASSSAGQTVHGQSGEELGSIVHLVGDLDLDGLQDLTLTSLTSNRIYLCWSSQLSGLGSVTAAEQCLALIAPSDSSAGAAVAGLGDTNGDGLSEFAVGAPIASAVYFVEAPFDGTLELSSMKTLQDTGADQAGSAVLGIGDVTRDGHGELVVGARISSINGNKSGAAFLLYGKGL